MNSVALGMTMMAAYAGALMGIGWAMAGRFALPASPAMRAGRAPGAMRRTGPARASVADAVLSETQARSEPQRPSVPATQAETSVVETAAALEPETAATGAGVIAAAGASSSREHPQDFDAVEEAIAAMPLDMPFARQPTVPFMPDANAASVDALLSSAAAPPALMMDAHRPAGLDAPRGSVGDDLKRIVGIGPKLERTLNELGIHHFDQIAGWSDDEVAWVNRHLRRKGRMKDEDWRSQAAALVTNSES